MPSPPPLTGLKTLEFAGLAPAPFTGTLLSTYGSTVTRIDRHPSAPPRDPLSHGKRSLRVNLKHPLGAALIAHLAQSADILLDPFRPGVLERLGLGPERLCAANPRLVYARLAGFRRDGKYKDMVGHDINYLAVSGTLGMLGRQGENPYAPANLLADFAAGGLMCAFGILLALVKREQTGRGQVVEVNMVDGAAAVSLWPRLMDAAGMWGKVRGANLLDGGAPFYDTYQTRDGGFMAVGALEPAFYRVLLEGLGLKEEEVPDRGDKSRWGELREVFTRRFRERTRREWEQVFDGTEACVTPVKTLRDLEEEGFERRPPVELKESPGVSRSDWKETLLEAGEGGKEALEEWFGLKEGEVWEEGEHGHVLIQKDGKAKL